MADPWVKFFPSDWLAGTSGLSPTERGVYITILMLIYEMEGPIVMDEGRLARRCGTTRPTFKKAIRSLLDEGKVTMADGKITNARAQEELSRREEISRKASLSANKKWNQKRTTESKKIVKNQDEHDAQAYAQAMRKLCGLYANQSPESDKEEEPNGSSKKKGSRLPDDWVLPKAWGDWALGQKFTEDQIRSEAEKFRDYWVGVSGQKGVKRDWLATWRNWLRNSAPKAAEGQRPRSNGQPVPSDFSRMDEMAELRRRKQEFIDLLDIRSLMENGGSPSPDELAKYGPQIRQIQSEIGAKP